MSTSSQSRVRLDEAILSRASALSTATMHEASGRKGALPAALRPLGSAMHCAGRALPVRCPRGDNLWIHHALAAAEAGDVLVVDAGDGGDFGYWGEIMATMAIARGVTGLIISGGVRDSLQLLELGHPTFSTAVTIRGTVKDKAGDGAVGEPIRLGEIVIRHGDLVVGDADGVVCFAVDIAAEVVEASEQRDLAEVEILEKLRQGATTLEVYNFD